MGAFSLELSDDQVQLRDWVHDFAADVIRPAAEEWDLAGLRQRLLLDFFIVADQLPQQNEPDEEPDEDHVLDGVLASSRDAFHRKIEGFGELSERVMSFVLLNAQCIPERALAK